MADDIVTRIREHLYGEPTKTSEFLLKLAANEIERLRTSGKELLDAFTEMDEKGMLPKITIRLRDAGQTFEQVVRGE